MKKFIFRFLGLVLALLITCTPAFATNHPMNKATHEKFVKKLLNIMSEFSGKVKKNHYTTPEFLEYISSWDKSNDDFDADHGFSVNGIGSTTFSVAMKVCHEHVTTSKEFVKRPFNCRGLSLFVLQELQNKSISSIIIQHVMKGTDELHDVVVYELNDKSFVCDLGRAMALCVINKCAPAIFKIDYHKRVGVKEPTMLLTIPIEDYLRECVDYVPKYVILPKIMKICDDPVYKIIAEKVKNKPANEVLNQICAYRNMTADELMRFYGVDTLGDAQKLVEGKSEDEVLTFIENRTRTMKTLDCSKV